MNDIDANTQLYVLAGTLAHQSRIMKGIERKKLSQIRKLTGKCYSKLDNGELIILHSKKHNKGGIRPDNASNIELSNEEKREEYTKKHYEDFWNLRQTRIVSMRRYARTLHLIRNYLYGTPYKEVEQKITGEVPNVDDLVNEVTKYINDGTGVNDPERALLRIQILEWLGATETTNSRDKKTIKFPEEV